MKTLSRLASASVAFVFALFLVLRANGARWPVFFAALPLATGGLFVARLGMIRSVGNRISGVKFVITPWAASFLTRNYPCFGMVVSGLDVAQRISEVKTSPRTGRPLEPVTIKKIRIAKVGSPPPLPDPVPHVPKAVQLEFRPDLPR